MTDVEAYESIIRWISEKTSLVTIKSHQSGTRPALPYLVVNLLNIRDVRERESDVYFTETEELNSEGNFKVNAVTDFQTEWEFSIHSYGQQVTSPLRKIKAIYRVSQQQETLLPDLIIHDVGTINIVPDFINEEWEPRGHCTLTLRGVTQEVIDTDVIEEIPITIT